MLDSVDEVDLERRFRGIHDLHKMVFIFTPEEEAEWKAKWGKERWNGELSSQDFLNADKYQNVVKRVRDDIGGADSDRFFLLLT
jgi:hypothetical protein